MGTHQNRPVQRACVTTFILAIGLYSSGCGNGSPSERAGLDPRYDAATGRLQQLRYDSDKNGKVDTVSFMDGTRLIRIEVDKDEDGRVERWEHYGPDRRLEKVGFSRANDGKEDSWSFADAGGSLVRIDISTERDGRITRVEHYQHGILARVDEDDDRDGRIDRWESYDGDRLSMVAFDSVRRGRPDRRLVYAADGGARLEVDPDGDGVFAPER